MVRKMGRYQNGNGHTMMELPERGPGRIFFVQVFLTVYYLAYFF